MSTTQLSLEWLCRQIVTHSQDAIIFADLEGTIRLWNAGAAQMFGYSPGEALGQSLDLIIPENLRLRHWEGYRRVMAGGAARYGRELLRVPALHQDGRRLSLEFSLGLIRQENGEILGAAAIIREVTDRRQREQELRQQLEALKARSGSGKEPGPPGVSPPQSWEPEEA